MSPYRVEFPRPSLLKAGVVLTLSSALAWFVVANWSLHTASRADRLAIHRQIDEGRADRRDLRAEQGELKAGQAAILDRLDRIVGHLGRIEAAVEATGPMGPAGPGAGGGDRDRKPKPTFNLEAGPGL